jgi:hypothetical protein
MWAKRILYFLYFVLFNSQVFGQICLNDIELNRISQYKVQEYIHYQQNHGIQAFSDIKPSLEADSDIKGYFIRENEYQIKNDIEEVWNLYLNTDATKLWNGKKISFGFLFSKKEDRIVYCDESNSKIDTGTIVYLNLRLMSGLKNLATAFEFINIDSENKVIEFSYLTGNLSEGKQRVQFLKTQKGYTRILHTSYYKSNNVFKNYIFYPYFHTRTTNEFHRNLRKLMTHNQHYSLIFN